jgi:hypothetical protein
MTTTLIKKNASLDEVIETVRNLQPTTDVKFSSGALLKILTAIKKEIEK